MRGFRGLKGLSICHSRVTIVLMLNSRVESGEKAEKEPQNIEEKPEKPKKSAQKKEKKAKGEEGFQIWSELETQRSKFLVRRFG